LHHANNIIFKNFNAMGNTLVNALRTKDTVTENGMVTNSTTLNMCVDLFSRIGALRGQDKKVLVNTFVKAYNENALTATKILFWARDVRGGAGERQIFRDLIEFLAKNETETLRKNLHLIPVYGRWDDLLVLFGTKLESEVLELIKTALAEGNGLCAKWMPRPSVKNAENRAISNTIRKSLGLSPKEFRKLLVGLTNVVETAMCSKEWGKIEYSKIPSKAMSDYMKAFGRRDGDRFTAYLESLKKGETKINAGAIYPYDVVKNMRLGNSAGADLQWKALPNYLVNSNELILPMVDVSGSMESPVGGNKNLTCYDVAVSLGLYISERNVGDFKDAFITFTKQPKLQYLKGSLSQRYNQMNGDVGYDTNLRAAFEMVLNKAVQGKVSQKDMPTMILVLSDMEFNSSSVGGFSESAQEMITRLYETAGYKVPKLVYWNIQSRHDNSPVQFNEQGTALVSGFSPSLLTGLLAGKSITPYSMMCDVIDTERYAAVTV